MPISQSNPGENSPVIAGCQIAGKKCLGFDRIRSFALNSFSNNAMHSRAK
jgi:hypothetical protein